MVSNDTTFVPFNSILGCFRVGLSLYDKVVGCTNKQIYYNTAQRDTTVASMEDIRNTSSISPWTYLWNLFGDLFGNITKGCNPIPVPKDLRTCWPCGSCDQAPGSCSYPNRLYSLFILPKCGFLWNMVYLRYILYPKFVASMQFISYRINMFPYENESFVWMMEIAAPTVPCQNMVYVMWSCIPCHGNPCIRYISPKQLQLKDV